MPPLVLIAIAWVAGLVVAQYLLAPSGVEPAVVAILALIPVGGLFLWRRDRDMVLSAACGLALLLGALRYQLALPDLDDPSLVAHYNGSGWVTMEGVVTRYPDVRDTWTDVTLDAEWIEAGAQVHDVKGAVLVRAPRFPEMHYGDRLRVSGFLETPPQIESFSYQDYLARKGMHSLIWRPQIERTASGEGSPYWSTLYAFKDRARDVIARLMPEPEASLLQGILLGIRSGIPRDLYEDFNATGTSHIIVISGTNITIIAGLFALSFTRLLGKRRAYWFVMAGILVYVLLVGADAVVVRAGVMGALWVTARHLGRQATAYVSLCASVIFLTAITPLALWDVGFQLSFAATLGLILFTAPLERLTERLLTRVVSPERAREIVYYLNDVLIVTLAAQILTFPLIAFYFGRVSLVAPLANLLVLPVQPAIMAWGGAATLVGLAPFLEPVAQILGWVPWLFLAYTTRVVQWMAAWPWASVPISRVGAAWLLFGCVLLLAGVWILRQIRVSARQVAFWAGQWWSKAVFLGVLVVVAILIWLAVLQLPDGRLHVHILDVGQGDAILVTTPSGQQILVDGGPSPSALLSALGKRMPFWDRSIDLVVMTHADADHLTGLVEVLGRYEVDAWMDNGADASDMLYRQCLTLLDREAVPHLVASAGQRFALEEGIVMDVLHPEERLMTHTRADDNNNSVVLRLSWGEASFLLTGDIEAEAEALLLRSGQPLRADVLKVAHHGSGGSSTAEFLREVDPAFAAISVGAENLAGHPAQEVLDRLAEVPGVTVLRTDEQGTIEFISDGRQLWVRTGR
jgi:competence protein ComEC